MVALTIWRGMRKSKRMEELPAYRTIPMLERLSICSITGQQYQRKKETKGNFMIHDSRFPRSCKCCSILSILLWA